MRILTVKIGESGSASLDPNNVLGYVGEHLITRVQVEMNALWVSENTIFYRIVFELPNDTSYTSAKLAPSDNTISLDVEQSLMVSDGYAKTVIVAYGEENDVITEIQKTEIIDLRVLPSISAEDLIPEGTDQQVEQHVLEAETAATAAASSASAASSIKDEIQQKLDDGEFVGEQGPQGPPGGTWTGASEIPVINDIGVNTNVQRAIQLAGAKIDRSEVISKKNRKPMMTFIDDDGAGTFYTKWLPVIDEKSISVTCALVASWVNTGTFLTWDQIETLKGHGAEFVNHSYSHEGYGVTLTPEEVEADLIQAQSILYQHDCKADIFVYPGGATNNDAIKVVRQYCRCGFNASTFSLNTPPLKTFNLNRVSMGTTGDTSLEYYKSQVDEAVANNGWLVWMTHSQYSTLDETQMGYIREVIDYARSLNVDIVNVEDGLNKIGNAVDAGIYPDAPYNIVDCDGKTYSSDINLTIDNSSSIVFDTPVTDFAHNVITRTTILTTTGAGAGFPEAAGILDTFYNTYSAGQSYQIFYGYTHKRCIPKELDGWIIFVGEL